MNTQETLQVLKKLYTAVVCDVMDGLGYRNQALPCSIRPLSAETRVSGRIYTALAQRVHATPAEPYKLEIAVIEAMSAGDVLLIDGGNDRQCGLWGELLTTACLAKGVQGVVMTASSRDLWKIKELRFPVFGIGAHPVDSKGRMDIVQIGQPICMGGVHAKVGDFLIGDEDGTAVIPQDIADETMRLALEKISGENKVREELAAGKAMSAVFRKYGIL